MQSIGDSPHGQPNGIHHLGRDCPRMLASSGIVRVEHQGVSGF